MMKTNETRTQKIVATKAAVRNARSNRITVGGFDLYPFDSANWCIEPQGCTDDDKRWYYPTFKTAVAALLTRAVDNAARNTIELRQVIQAIQQAERRIMEAVAGRESS